MPKYTSIKHGLLENHSLTLHILGEKTVGQIFMCEISTTLLLKGVITLLYILTVYVSVYTLIYTFNT